MSDQRIVQKQGLFESIAAAWQGFRRKMRQRNELSTLEPVEARRMADEFGVSVGQLREMIDQGPDAARQLYERLAQARIGTETISSETMRDLQRCCGYCDSKPLCDHELQDQPKTASWPKYCPNELTIRALNAPRCH